MRRPRPVVAALLLAVGCLVTGCGDTEPDEPGEGQGPTTEATSDSGDANRDEAPDVYNDEDNEGEQPDADGTDAGSN